MINLEAPWVAAFSIRDYERMTERAAAAYATLTRSAQPSRPLRAASGPAHGSASICAAVRQPQRGPRCSSSRSSSRDRSSSASRPRSAVLMLVILLRSALSSEGPSGLGRLMSRPDHEVRLRLPVPRLGRRLRDRPAARPPRRRELALRRHRADRDVHRLLHHDGLHLVGDRGVARPANRGTSVTAAASRRAISASRTAGPSGLWTGLDAPRYDPRNLQSA